MTVALDTVVRDHPYPRIQVEAQALPSAIAPPILGSATATNAPPNGLDIEWPSLLRRSVEPQGKPSVEHVRIDSGADKAAKANKIRLELLARRFAAEPLTMEEEARLAIVKARVEALFPRVTAVDFALVAAVETARAKLASRNEERRRRLGLD